MGLRIRRAGNWGEQTIKFAGKQRGAMSARPEYNVETTALRPSLELFPTHIWPEHWRPSELTAELAPQFEVTFTRRTWLYQGTDFTVEVAFDQGVITAAAKHEPVQELELELKAGSAESLLAFGAELAVRFELKPGLKSKAQRGYELYAESFSSEGS